jgi:hypothetical protein
MVRWLGGQLMSDNYVQEAIHRYKSDHERYVEINSQIKTLKEEAQKLYSRLGAYERIIEDELGKAAMRRLEEELEAINTQEESGSSRSLEQAALTDSNKPSITDAILAVIKKSGTEGVTPAQVINGVLFLGFGPEKRTRSMES